MKSKKRKRIDPKAKVPSCVCGDCANRPIGNGKPSTPPWKNWFQMDPSSGIDPAQLWCTTSRPPEEWVGKCPKDTGAALETAAEKLRMGKDVKLTGEEARLKTKLAAEKSRRRTAEKKCTTLLAQLKKLACEKARRRSAEKECAKLQEQLDGMSKNDDLACEKARRRSAEKECAKLQEQLDGMSKNDDLACEKAKRRNAEKECEEMLQQLAAMSKIHELACERRRSAEEECAQLQEQLDGMSKNDDLACEKAKRRNAEKECEEMLQQLAAMSKIHELACERHRSAEEECAQLQEQLATISAKLLDLEGRMQMQKAVSGLSHGVSWQYEMDGGWEAFTPEANEKTHQAYLDFLRGIPGSRSATINSGGVDRVVDFQLMQQAHMVTRKKRRIRISPGVPPQWVTPTPDLLQQSNDVHSFYKEVTDDRIWDSLRYILQNTGHSWDQTKDCSCMRRAEVKSVHRIENMRLWHRYKTRLDGMRQDHASCNISVGLADLDLDGYGNIMAQSQQIFDCGEPLALDIDEKILLHGTSWKNANSIVCEGFDNRMCQNAFYGAGVYFACAACKSHQYTCNQHKKCCSCKCPRTVIIARVALGDSFVATETRKKERRPPVRSGSSGTYDSIVVKPGLIKGHHKPNQVHQEYVIFDREQAYPAFVVEYTLWGSLGGIWPWKKVDPLRIVWGLGIETCCSMWKKDLRSQRYLASLDGFTLGSTAFASHSGCFVRFCMWGCSSLSQKNCNKLD